MRLPLSKMLKKRMHVDIATLQDEVVDIVYLLLPRAVLHGGTAIWRCYGGNRFSEDLDFYASPGNGFEKIFERIVKERGLVLNKYKKTENTFFAKLSDGNVEIRVEIALRDVRSPVVRLYEKTNGSQISVFTLSPEDIILEKMSAYSSRKLARDIYDIYHLSSYVTDEKKLMKEMRDFLSKIKPPLDEKNLKMLVYSGAVPSFKQMVEALKRRVEE
ncbi:MAG: nucleotidyl transferase AbiEii/AbiGii toxin family protein [Candidatus Anstonellales archaeon]